MVAIVLIAFVVLCGGCVVAGGLAELLGWVLDRIGIKVGGC